MIKTQFGIIDEIDYTKDYSDYEPEKYNCVYIDDDYIEDWWPQLCLVKSFYHSMDRPDIALARYGVTIIPPESLPAFQDIVLSDSRISADIHLVELSEVIQTAIDKNKHIIHYGI